MAKIIFYETKPWEAEFIKGAFGDGALLRDGRIGPDVLPAEEDRDAEIISVFIDSQITADVIAAFPKLRMIATRSTGFDHIDSAACRAKNVAVANVPSYGENTVAEHAFALLLGLSRKIFYAYDRIKEAGDFRYDGLQGFDLKGKTIGVIGTGRIGRHAIKIARGFEMSVVAYDPHPNAELQKEFAFQYMPLEDVLRASDIVTLHVPYTKETHHLIDAARLALMKPTALLINTSRGGLVDTEALVAALRTGKLGGAGLDVLEEEGVIKDEIDFLLHGNAEGHSIKTILANHILIDMPNVIITPHIAYNTQEALIRILQTTVENIKNTEAGKPTNLVG